MKTRALPGCLSTYQSWRHAHDNLAGHSDGSKNSSSCSTRRPSYSHCRGRDVAGHGDDRRPRTDRRRANRPGPECQRRARYSSVGSAVRCRADQRPPSRRGLVCGRKCLGRPERFLSCSLRETTASSGIIIQAFRPIRSRPTCRSWSPRSAISSPNRRTWGAPRWRVRERLMPTSHEEQPRSRSSRKDQQTVIGENEPSGLCRSDNHDAGGSFSRGHVTGAAQLDGLRDLLTVGGKKLPKRLAQVATFALANPDDIAFGTAASIAEQAHVQPSALIRFARHGYQGFSDLQSVFRDRLRKRVLSYEERLVALRASPETACGAAMLRKASPMRRSFRCGPSEPRSTPPRSSVLSPSWSTPKRSTSWANGDLFPSSLI